MVEMGKTNLVRTSAGVKKRLIQAGVTVAAIAPACALKDAPAGHRAEDIMPGAKSVIVFGIKLVSGAVNWPSLIWEDTRQTKIDCWRVYDQCCFDAVNIKLEQIGMDIAIALELEEYQAIFFPGSTDPTIVEERSFRKFEGMELPQLIETQKIDALKDGLEKPTRAGAPLSFRHAAVAAGLATFGANNLALHPVFGPRVRFNAVVTDCEFDHYDTPLKEQVCLYDKGCRACIETCPYQTFHEVTRFSFAGLEHPWAQMRGFCAYNSIACAGVCLLTCPAGSGDKQMKRRVAERYSTNRYLNLSSQ